MENKVHVWCDCTAAQAGPNTASALRYRATGTRLASCRHLAVNSPNSISVSCVGILAYLLPSCSTTLRLSESIPAVVMASSVYYKFKSQRTESKVAFDGTGISVFDLKKEIILANSLKANDCDLQLLDPSTNQGLYASRLCWGAMVSHSMSS